MTLSLKQLIQFASCSRYTQTGATMLTEEWRRCRSSAVCTRPHSPDKRSDRIKSLKSPVWVFPVTVQGLRYSNTRCVLGWLDRCGFHVPTGHQRTSALWVGWVFCIHERSSKGKTIAGNHKSEAEVFLYSTAGTPQRVPPPKKNNTFLYMGNFFAVFECYFFKEEELLGLVLLTVELSAEFFCLAPSEIHTCKYSQKFNISLWSHLCPLAWANTHPRVSTPGWLSPAHSDLFPLASTSSQLQSFVCLRRFPEGMHIFLMSLPPFQIMRPFSDFICQT